MKTTQKMFTSSKISEIVMSFSDEQQVNINGDYDCLPLVKKKLLKKKVVGAVRRPGRMSSLKPSHSDVRVGGISCMGGKLM